MAMRNILAFVYLGYLVLPVRAEEPAKYQPIDKETISAYQKLPRGEQDPRHR